MPPYHPLYGRKKPVQRMNVFQITNSALIDLDCVCAISPMLFTLSTNSDYAPYPYEKDWFVYLVLKFQSDPFKLVLCDDIVVHLGDSYATVQQARQNQKEKAEAEYHRLIDLWQRKQDT